LFTAVLARQAAAAVGVGTCWPWETAATLPSARRRKALRRPLGEEMGGDISWRPPAYSLLVTGSATVVLASAWRSLLMQAIRDDRVVVRHLPVVGDTRGLYRFPTRSSNANRSRVSIRVKPVNIFLSSNLTTM